MNKRFIPVMTLFALSAAGCNAVIVEDLPGPRFAYRDGDFEYATNKGAIVAVVAGNPFGMDRNRFGDLVRGVMQDQIDVATGAKFVAAPTDETLAPYKIVVAFNPPPHIDNHDLCERGADTPTVPSGTTTEARMAFCHGDGLKSGSAAWVDNLSGIDDPRFMQLIRHATQALLPSQDSEEDGEGSIRD